MRPVNRPAAAVLHALTAGLTKPGDARTIDNTNGVFMPVHVECIGPDTFSIAHYGEQNGDRMRDPEMVFWRQRGEFYPIYFRNDYAGLEQTSAHFVAAGLPRFFPRLQRQHAQFAGMWMRNIKHQQGLKLAGPVVLETRTTIVERREVKP